MLAYGDGRARRTGLAVGPAVALSTVPNDSATDNERRAQNKICGRKGLCMVPSFSAIASLRCPLLNSQRIFAREWTTQQRTAVTAVTEQLISSCLGCTSSLMQRTPACTLQLLACASIFLGFVVLHKCGDETPARAKREHKQGSCQISDQCTRRRTLRAAKKTKSST